MKFWNFGIFPTFFLFCFFNTINLYKNRRLKTRTTRYSKDNKNEQHITKNKKKPNANLLGNTKCHKPSSWERASEAS